MPVERTIIEWQLEAETREELRMAVLIKWGQERYGHGRAEASQKYRYNVETLPKDGCIYLHRPAFLNKGCDFVVHCDPPIPRDDHKKFKNPRHQDLIGELKLLAEQIPDGRKHILDAVEAVWHCNNVSKICESLCNGINDPDLSFRAERALKVAKWLFIEQDITDWNTSGRAMLMNGIRTVLS